jgi:hypothetical protein
VAADDAVVAASTRDRRRQSLQARPPLMQPHRTTLSVGYNPPRALKAMGSNRIGPLAAAAICLLV